MSVSAVKPEKPSLGLHPETEGWLNEAEAGQGPGPAAEDRGRRGDRGSRPPDPLALGEGRVRAPRAQVPRRPAVVEGVGYPAATPAGPASGRDRGARRGDRVNGYPGPGEY